ncbi:MAG: hypothetical protein ACK4PH_24430 [Aquincola tertiaricarbonis]
MARRAVLRLSGLGTAGRAIQQYGPKGGWVELDGQRIDIRAKVHTLAGYSATPTSRICCGSSGR